MVNLPTEISQCYRLQNRYMANRKISTATDVRTSEYAAPWADWIGFESEAAHERRVRLEDPFAAAPFLEALITQSSEGDATAAYTMYSFAQSTERRGPWAVIPSFDQQDAMAPKNWTPEHKENWMRIAARGGYWIAAFAALNTADRLPDGDPRRPALIEDAMKGLELAVRAGSLEALQALAMKLQSGEQVAKDLPRSYAYLQVVALAAPEGNEYWDQCAGEVRALLNEEDLRNVRVIQQELAAALSQGTGRLQ